MRSVFLTVLVLLFIVGLLAFFLGTIVGFNTAFDSLSNCVEVRCEKIGVDAEKCELCPYEGDTIRKSISKVG